MSEVVKGRFFRKARTDPRIKKLREMLETGIFAVDTERQIKELEELHATRKFRAYEAKDVLSSAQKYVVRATMQEAAYRSRAVTIKMQAFRISALLDEHIGNISDYLLTEYDGVLKNEYSNIKTRDRAVNTILEDFLKLRSKLGVVEKLADMLIEDIDKTSFSIKHTVETLQMSFQKERNI